MQTDDRPSQTEVRDIARPYRSEAADAYQIFVRHWPRVVVRNRASACRHKNTKTPLWLRRSTAGRFSLPWSSSAERSAQ